ncbi:phosphoglycerate kinase [Candidatus Gottesmanbacteria bacterium]|nr:phosphoglycerate kinase [Candidatus Gottesmanbacteria bacterium]
MKKTIKGIPVLKNKTVFLTVDFNISLHNGKIANDTRIREALPTIDYLLKKGAKLVLASHLGRPKGYDLQFSLKPVAEHLQKIVSQKVFLVDKYWYPERNQEVNDKAKQGIVLLENIRFTENESRNDDNFSRHLSSMADYFVNDAFGTSHRVHASIVGIAQYLPSYAGLLLDKEIRMLNKALLNPKKPFVVIIGGAKTPEKISVIEKLLDIADTVILGGAIANTFLAAWGFGMGRSMIDYEMIEMAKVVFWKTSRQHSALILPHDVIITTDSDKKKLVTVDYNKVPSDASIFDIGPETRKLYGQLIENAKTIIWNGPMGLFEDERFKDGTESVLKSVAESRAFSIVGGGDTLTSIKNKDYLNKIKHVSTGGSAMLEFIKKGSLPGIDVLMDA